MAKAYCFSYGEVFEAYEDCIKNKRNTSNAREFEIDYIEKVTRLCDDINDGTYEIGKSIAFVVTFPVYREVFAADFRDRIVHHLVIKELMPYFEKYFIKESFSCMEGKSVLYGVKTMFEYIKECTENYTKDAWILKMDIKSFFMSINKQLLADMIDDFIVEYYENDRKKEKLRELCKQIVLHHPELNCEKRGDKSLWAKLDPNKSLFNVGYERGLPIGNLTSQIFANFFLTKLDRFIKETLGFKYYGRYVDDFMIVSTDKEKLKNSVDKIIEFAQRELKLTIHPNKRYFQHYTKGVQFIGSVIKPNRIYVLNRTKGSLYYKLRNLFNNPDEKRLDKLIMTVNSYIGYMKHYNTYNIRKFFLNNSGLLDKWEDLIIIDEKYEKINRKEKPKQVTAKDVFVIKD